MATATGKMQCSICEKERRTAYKCEGCSKYFCLNHLTEHHRTLTTQLNEIENDRNVFLQTILEHKEDPTKHFLIEQINRWEGDSIKKIKQTAKECRERLIEHRNKHIDRIENELNPFTDQLRTIREDNDINEIILEKLKIKLTELTKEFVKPLNISIQHDCTSYIDQISVVPQSEYSSLSHFHSNTKWKQHGTIVAGGNGRGEKLNQLFYPQGISIDDHQTIYIADCANHRIIRWKSNENNGEILAGGNNRGERNDQLNAPTDVIIDKQTDSLIIADQNNRRVMRWSCENNANGHIIIDDIDCYGLTMDKNGSIYVSDWEKNEVRRWKRGEKDGIIVAGGNGRGAHLNQLNFPSYLFIDEDDSLYVSDYENHRVMKWVEGAKEGIVVAGGNGDGKNLTQLSFPMGVVVDRLGQIYVADRGNARVMRWCVEGDEGSVVGGDGNGEREESNQLNDSCGLSFDSEGNLYVVDCENNRIVKFEVDLN